MLEVTTVDPSIKPLPVEANVKPSTPEPLLAEPEGDVHPLEPGGERFKQVWARAKAAEEREKRLEAEAQHEREERIRYEERIKALEASPPAKREPVYTRTQLEEFVANGQLTRAQAEEYNEARVRREIAEESDRRLEAKLAGIQRSQRIQTDLDRYKELVPTIMQAGTAEREKVSAEYRYMTTTLGMPEGVATELAAARAAFGDLSALERSRIAASTTRENREVTVETSVTGKGSGTTKDPLSTLTPRQREHYEKMIKNGRYPKGWDDVRDELNFVPGL